LNRRAELVHETPNFDEKRFLYHLSRTNYEKEWGRGYRRPGFGARVLAFFLRVVPKVGPASALDFKIPTTQTEAMYISSVNKTSDDYNSLLRQVRQGKMNFVDTDCDTGRDTHAAEYSLADETYARLLRDLSKRNFAQITPELRGNILVFYANPNAPFHDKRNPKQWRETEQALERLKNLQSNPLSSQLLEAR
jgi:hypothetical protein